MKVIVNGSAVELPAGATLGNVLALAKARADRVAVVVNDEVVPSAGREARPVREGDRIEIFGYAAGG